MQRKKKPVRRRPKNPSEAKCYDTLELLGFKPGKRGWPDFALFDSHGKLVGVEVKPNPHRRLRDTQSNIMGALVRAGIPCFRYDPISGFCPIDIYGECTHKWGQPYQPLPPELF